ncbi:MAG: sigma-54-dependent Fis family transcriptional regulator [Deltaproteobacteria bacterium]|nr:sigma-54-dependent Fis family transcriptional regulator [Deltaproteobacteria bacterium]
MTTVLIADDESNLRKVLCALLKREGYETLAVANGEAAIDVLNSNDIDILITDLRMPGMDGLELLRLVKTIDPSLPVIVITAHGSVDTAVSAMKEGAFDYITKPFDRDELKLSVRKAASVHSITQTHLVDSGDSGGRYQIIGESSRMREIYGVIEKVAATPSTVLITGESGTGKELVASALHDNSLRKGKPFIKVNCAAIPKDLMESEFFGYERGAFTGAISSKPGRFELADSGTLFLDEIAEIPTAMQVKLLRALQESEFERVGGIRSIKVDVRVIAATNRDLVKQIEDGSFREDLYYRLNVVPIALPPLRERKEDIPYLTQAFIEKYNKRLNKNVNGISEEALQRLSLYSWPGNIRELENVIERTLLFCESSKIEIKELPDYFKQLEYRFSSPSIPNIAFKTETINMPTIDSGNTTMKDIVKQATVEIERDLIVKALDETNGNVTKAAAILGISRKGLQNKMKELGLRDPDSKN